MPEDRSKHPDPEFGFLEPETIRPGRCTIRQALDFLTDHANDPTETGSVKSIAQRYKLDERRVQNVVRYFNVFNIHLPKKLLDSLPNKADGDKLLQHREHVRIGSGKSDSREATSTTVPFSEK